MRIVPGLLLTLAIAACGRDGALGVTDARVTRPPPGADMAAGYFTIGNGTSQAVELRGVSSPEFGNVEMHETTIENGVSKMRPLPSLSIPAHGEARFEQSGRHLMMMAPKVPLEATKEVHLSLAFRAANGSPVKIEATAPLEDANAVRAP